MSAPQVSTTGSNVDYGDVGGHGKEGAEEEDMVHLLMLVFMHCETSSTVVVVEYSHSWRQV